VGSNELTGDMTEGDPPELQGSDPCEEPVGTDAVATSRALARAAKRLLAADRLDDDEVGEIRVACEELAADRTNGENLDEPIQRVRDLLAHHRDEGLAPPR